MTVNHFGSDCSLLSTHRWQYCGMCSAAVNLATSNLFYRQFPTHCRLLRKSESFAPVKCPQKYECASNPPFTTIARYFVSIIFIVHLISFWVKLSYQFELKELWKHFAEVLGTQKSPMPQCFCLSNAFAFNHFSIILSTTSGRLQQSMSFTFFQWVHRSFSRMDNDTFPIQFLEIKSMTWEQLVSEAVHLRSFLVILLSRLVVSLMVCRHISYTSTHFIAAPFLFSSCKFSGAVASLYYPIALTSVRLVKALPWPDTVR